MKTAGRPAVLCDTSGHRITDPALALRPGEDDAPGGRVECLRCGRTLTLIMGMFNRPVAPAHPASGAA